MTLSRPMFPPVDPTRRRFLSVAAGATALTLSPARAATPAVDPIYAAIERHKAAGAIWEAASDIRGRFIDMDMNPEQERQCELLQEAADTAWEPCEQAGIDLITTEPTTLAGIDAAVRYIRIQMHDDGTFMPHQIEFEFDSGSEGDNGETLGWVDVFLETIADAAAALASAMVQS